MHRAAYRMVVLEESLPTVEQIAADSGVSPRTFFNYFRTKEEAIIGLRQPKLTDRQRECLAQEHNGSQFDAVVLVLFGVIRDSVVDRAHFLERVKHLKTHTEYRFNISRHLGECESVVLEGIAPTSESGGDGVSRYSEMEDRTRALIILAGSVARYTFATHPDAMTEDSSEHVRAALEVFRQVMKEAI